MSDIYGPFTEAIEFQRSRTPLTRSEYAKLDNEARARAFTIAGLAKYSTLLEASDLAFEAVERGETIGEFNRLLADLVAKNGGTLLNRRRQDLIFRNNNATAVSAGRWNQIQRVKDQRPWVQYPLGPNDSRTSTMCRALQGLVFRIDSKLAKRIWPPNHHDERHLSPRTLTDEQAEASGRVYEGPEDDLYPWVEDPETGQARRVMPDEGFDTDPSLVASDGSHFRKVAAEKLGRTIDRKTAATYELGALADIDAAKLPAAPGRGTPILDIDDPAEYAAAWDRFRASVGIADDASSTMLLDYAGEGVRVTRESFEHIVGLDKPEQKKSKWDRSVWFPFIGPTLRDPHEVWWVPNRDSDGKVVWVKRFIGLFRDSKGVVTIPLIVDRTPEGWLLESMHRASDGESFRRGLLAFTKSGRTS